MATLVSNPKISNHYRSISLPNTSHPLLTNAEQRLRKFKSFGGAHEPSTTTSTSQKLDDLKNLCHCMDDLLQLPRTQQLLSLERNGTWEEEILDGSLRLLDICNTARDAYSLVKDSAQEVESSLRRKRGGDHLINEVNAYMVARKNLNRFVNRCFKEMKKVEKHCQVVAVKDHAAASLIKKIKEAQEMSLNLLKSGVPFVSEPHARGWSLASRLLHQDKVQSDSSEIQSIEVELLLLNSKKSSKEADLVRIRNLVKRLAALGSVIQETVEVLEVVVRVLVKARVSLLNIINY